MKKLFLLTLLLTMQLAILMSQSQHSGTILFDDGWRFFRGGALGAELPEFNDSAWRAVDLPHDWSIEDIPGSSSPFGPAAISQVSGGFTVGGTGWYRKTFYLPEEDSTRHFGILFEGAYMQTIVWVNGLEVGQHYYGYTSFCFDITPFLKSGKQNLVAVKVVNEGENSRWYSGSGLYRHVWLCKTNRIHIPQWGVYITTPEITPAESKVVITTQVRNDSRENAGILLRNTILDPTGTKVGDTTSSLPVSPGGQAEFRQEIRVPAPKLWSPDHPVLYSVSTELMENGKVIDQAVTPFGIRSIAYNPEKGFLLNGQRIKLKGGCVHHDNGPLGAKAYDRAEERRVELLKASGFNAIRCAHNPPSPAFLNACDRIGMLVIDEAFDMWDTEKNPADYHLFFNQCWKNDMESMVLRDRNHPSVVMWSIGNEIPGTDRPEVVRTARMLASCIRTMDSTRPVTSAVNKSGESRDSMFAVLDIAGYNYLRNNYIPDHQRVLARVMMATESYPLEAFDYWMGVTDNPWVIGDFVWTAFDYIGEASIGWLGYYQRVSFYPWNLAYCGDIDICGWKRPQSYYRDVLWEPNQISLFVQPPQPSFAINPQKEDWSIWNWNDVTADWNWDGYEGHPLEVTVYSSCEKAELFLNGKSFGIKETNRKTRFTATWKVPYQKGELKAAGYNGKSQAGFALLCSAENPVTIKMHADRPVITANGQDLCYVTVELQDAKGHRNPKAENLVHFEISGPGTIIGTGNANPVSTESYRAPQRKAWQGRCLVIIKSDKQPGTIELKASSDGLKTERLAILSQP